ncbi:hypothetical protein N8878_05560 [Psychromonas sp.]|nr:hypothetical protein [Psychromonas sp.]
MEKFKLTLFFIIYAFSLFMTGLLVAVTISDPLRGKEFSIATVILGVVFGLITFYLKRQITGSKNDIIESSTLKMAISNDGFVTAIEIAASNALRLKDVNKYLAECCESGICEKRYTEDNLVEVFYFRDSVSLEAKKASKPKTEVCID